MSKKIFTILIALFLFSSINVMVLAEEEININLSEEKILVDNNEISTEVNAVYLKKVNEKHEDVAEEFKNVENNVVCITKAGTYRITGTAVNTQIYVDTEDSEQVILILDNVDIRCNTAPAILVMKALESNKAGEAGVHIQLVGENNITGSHIAEYYDENNTKYKSDGAISSEVSLLIEGDGKLNLNADNEGIESEMHLTINSGEITIHSCDDALNASEDNVSYITINGGYIYAMVDSGTEGDGIDSNGYIVINDGFVIAEANSNSGDSGLDADLGIIINGGTVVATGNMYEGIDNQSKQQFMQMYFSEAQKTGNLIVITDKKGGVVLAYKPVNAYTIMEFSSPVLSDGIFYVYEGGNIEGTEVNGFYTNVISYENGVQLSHAGTMTNSGRPSMPSRDDASGQQPINDNFDPEGTPPNFDKENIPEPKELPEGEMKNGKRPDDMRSRDDRNVTRSYEFELSAESHVFKDVSATEPSEITNEGNAEVIDKKVLIIIVAVTLLAIVAIILVCRKAKKVK